MQLPLSDSSCNCDYQILLILENHPGRDFPFLMFCRGCQPVSELSCVLQGLHMVLNISLLGWQTFLCEVATRLDKQPTEWHIHW